MSLSLDTSALRTATGWIKEGVTGLRARVGSLSLFASTEAVLIPTQSRDETHYFLVPTPSKEGYVLAERRCLPSGEPLVNDLPKVRVFHLPSMAALPLLEERILGTLTLSPNLQGTPEEAIARRLEAIGAAIDAQASKLTGGLLIVAGVIACVHPVVGAGIALKALLPNVSATLLRAGSDAAASAVRSSGRALRLGSATRAAKAEVARLKPEVHIDPVLRFMAAVCATESTLDPIVDEAVHLGDWVRRPEAHLSMGVVCDVVDQAQGLLGAWLTTARARLSAFQG